MEHRTINDRIDDLNTRVKRLEKAVGTEKKSEGFLSGFFSSRDLKHDKGLSRILGWALTVFSTLCVLATWGYPSNTYFVLALGIGLWLIARASNLIDISDSHRALLGEGGRGTSAHAVHHGIHTLKRKREKQSQPSAPQALTLFVGSVGLIAVLSYGLLSQVGQSYLSGIVVSVIFAVFLFFASRLAGKWVLYLCGIGLYYSVSASFTPLVGLILVSILTLVGLFLASRWKDRVLELGSIVAGLVASQVVISGASQNEYVGSFQFAVGVALVLFALLPHIDARQTLKDKIYVRNSVLAGTIGFVLTIVSGSLAYVGGQWLIATALGAVLWTIFGMIAWYTHGRMSYAKYFGTAALVFLSLFFYVALDSVSVTLLWFMLGVVVTAIGFTLPSYSARMVGLGVLGLSFLNYVATVFPYQDTFSSIPLLHERVWFGVLFSVFAVVLAKWYQEAQLRGSEKFLAPVISMLCVATSFVTMVTVVYFEAYGLWQSVIWLALSFIYLWVIQGVRVQVVSVLAILLGLVSLIRMITVDSLSLDGSWRVAVFSLVSLVIVGIGVAMPKYRTLLRIIR